jgi:hypothetical protein
MTDLLDIEKAEFDRHFATFSFGMRHQLVDDPRFALEALAGLADGLPDGSIERNRGDLPTVVTDQVAQIQGPPSETVLNIESNGAWMVMWNIEQSPRYAQLLDQCLDEVEALVQGNEGGMTKREGFIFLSAPNAVTPAHIDPEHNFLLQIRGYKEMNVGRFESPSSQQLELERYMGGGHRNLTAFPGEPTTFGLNPGDGVYVAPFAPHWVKNGPAASVSLSITWRTAATERAAKVHTLNRRLRRLKLSPKPPGVSPGVDRAKEKVMRALESIRR